MKILFLSSYADPGSGASVLSRLAKNIQQRGHEVKILTTQPGFDSDIVETIVLPDGARFINRVINRITPNYFSLGYGRLMEVIRRYNPDIVNIHWTHGYTIPIRIVPELSKRFPVFWTIHDLWPITANSFFEFTGGKSLPSLQTAKFRDALKKLRFSPGILLDYKAHLLGNIVMHTVSPSRWLQEMVKESRVFRMSTNLHIPNGVDTTVFKCLDRSRLRKKYEIPQEQSVVLFLAAKLGDERKGFFYFAKAMEHLNLENPGLIARTTIVLVGASSQGGDTLLNGSIRVLGSTKNASELAEYYNLADVFVSASLADNFPSTALESCACGTPIVAFDVGGVSEIVVDGKTGLLADSRNIVEMADNIHQILSNESMSNEMRKNCRQHIIDNFSMDQFVDRYIERFESELRWRAGNRAVSP